MRNNNNSDFPTEPGATKRALATAALLSGCDTRAMELAKAVRISPSNKSFVIGMYGDRDVQERIDSLVKDTEQFLEIPTSNNGAGSLSEGRTQEQNLASGALLSTYFSFHTQKMVSIIGTQESPLRPKERIGIYGNPCVDLCILNLVEDTNRLPERLPPRTLPPLKRRRLEDPQSREMNVPEASASLAGLVSVLPEPPGCDMHMLIGRDPMRGEFPYTLKYNSCQSPCREGRDR